MGESLMTIHEVESETGISAFTIRYYDKCGFFKTIARNSQGRRRFSQSDVDRLLLVDAFRKSGLSIDGLKVLVQKLDDPECSQEVEALCKQQLQALDIQMEDLEHCKTRLANFLEEKSGDKPVEPETRVIQL